MAHVNEEATPWWVRFFTLQPALVRGFLLTLFGLLASAGVLVIDDKMVSLIVNFALAFLGLGAAVVIKPSVTPNAKVVVRDETPLASISTLVAGDATPSGVSPSQVTRAAYAKETA